MKIALFASAFYPHVGGVEELVRQLAHAYRRAGDEAIVITNRWPRDLPDHEVYEGIDVYRLPMRIPEGSVKALTSYHLTHKSILQEIIRILQQHQTEMLHIQCVSTNGYYALLAKQHLGLPLVVTSQGERTMDAGRLYEHSKFMNTVLKQLLAEGEHVTACSANTLNDLATYRGEPFGARGEVVYNGIQLADFENVQPYSHPRPYILGIGRFVPQKGFDVLIEAYAKSGVESHDLLLAGEGDEREALASLAKSLKSDNKIHFVGRADRTTAVALFKGCSFFVLPSRHEPQGIVNLEAMASGKAVIASRVGGVPEIVLDGQTGILVPGEDSAELAKALLQLSEDSELREQLGTAGKARAQSFDWSAIAAQYQEIYRSVMPLASSTSSLV
jgi:glycosyltransferase involved in cell wall biosynthesis